MSSATTASSSWAIDKSERLKSLPPYLFVEIDKAKNRLREQGKDVIDLGVGDPDLPTPAPIITQLQQAADDPANHRVAGHGYGGLGPHVGKRPQPCTAPRREDEGAGEFGHLAIWLSGRR